MKNEKYESLILYLKQLEGAVVAFSGGVDSTFLLKAAKEALGEKVIAVTVVAPYTPKWEVEEAKALVQAFGVQHEFIEVPLLEEIRFSPEDRCYRCKGHIFGQIIALAKKRGINHVLDGTNYDDTKDHRPGMKALKELKVKSPLLEEKWTKKEIRDFSKELHLPTWDKPAYACLLSRIPYTQEVLLSDLERIEKAEMFLMDLGLKGSRVRSHQDLARLELHGQEMEKVLNVETLNTISTYLKSIGFRYVTLDLEGYRMGSLNKEIEGMDKI